MKCLVFILFAPLLVACAMSSESLSESVELVPASQVMLFKPVGSKQCASGADRHSLSQEMKTLESAGVRVLVAQCAHDGLMRPAVCGAETGELWLVAVPESDVATARAQGYQPVAPSDDFPVQECR